ncbi:flagellar biosynthetic protein FliO [uncultured Pseudoteredinibacter sp.]|uniref:flagellar biosynthetic protein FliO n=1 Tax=uncultured Pseudoteredinibacter sp. TaxID=1641701 RepID=UPI00260A9A4A|nr:flagellar biosynthetic protein FliO [uncultured Pseudoteredinibacter sp.]
MNFASNKFGLQIKLFCTISCAPILALAEQAAVEQPIANMPSASTQLLQVFVALGFVLAIIYALAWFLKRFSNQSSLSASPIKVLNSTSMGTREKLVLAEVNGQQILLGVTAHSINALHSFEQQSIPERVVENPEAVVDFKAKLAGLMAVNKKPV